MLFPGYVILMQVAETHRVRDLAKLIDSKTGTGIDYIRYVPTSCWQFNRVPCLLAAPSARSRVNVNMKQTCELWALLATIALCTTVVTACT
jgi:hypothetical protein